MTEEISYIPEPPETFVEAPEKKKNKTLWIILAIVAVILLCCCLAVVLAMVFGFSLDEFDPFVNLLPYLRWI
jgi:flagellar basal body-associated protein FliL